MSEYVALLGSEQVFSAGHAMSRAADQMQSAAGNIDGALFRFTQQMEEFVSRFEQATERLVAVLQLPSPPSTKERKE